MTEPRRRPFDPSIAYCCGVALLLLTTIAVAQNALDANLRVGSGGWNGPQQQRVATMSKSPYSVSSSGQVVYNRGVAFNSPEVYNRPAVQSQLRPWSAAPTPPGNAGAAGAVLASAQYSAARPVRSTISAPTIRTVNRPATGASLQQDGYTLRKAVDAMQIPTASIDLQPYSANRKDNAR